MADLGNLKQFVDDYDVAFSFGKKTYKIKPTAEQILDYKRKWNDIEDNKKKTDQATIWEFVAPLFGSHFNREEYRFEADDNPDGEHHGLILNLLDAGMTVDILDRLLGAAYAKYSFGDEVAEEVAKTGSLGKALQNVRKKNEEKDSPETQKDAGGTSESD